MTATLHAKIERSRGRARALALGAAVAFALLYSFWARSPSEIRTSEPAQNERDVLTASSRAATQAFERMPAPGSQRAPLVRNQPIIGRIQAAQGVALEQASVCSSASTEGDGAWLECVDSDASGRFELSDRQGRALFVFVSAPGYSPRTERAPEAWARQQRWTITLSPAAAGVSGKVADANGGFVAGALVVAQRPPSAEVLAASQTDADGRFSFGVPEGDLQLSAVAEGYARSVLTITAPAQAIQISLLPAAVIQGLVIAKLDGTPLGELTVIAQASAGLSASSIMTRTAGDGSFRLESVIPGNYELSAFGAGWRTAQHWVTLDSGQVSEVLTLEASAATGLKGTVSVAGAPCADGVVELVGTERRAASTGPGGVVSFEGLVPGHYRVAAHCLGGTSLHEELELTELMVRDWDLDTGLLARGRIETEDGQPVAGASVWAESVGALPGRSMSRCFSDASGAFVCSGLAVGDYEFSVHEGETASSDPVRWTLDGASEPELLLRTRSSGTIVATIDESDAPIADALLVMARDRAGNATRSLRRGDEFVFERLRLGRYVVYFEAATQASSRIEAVLEHAGQTLAVSLPAPRTTRITGRVVDAQREALADSSIRALPADVSSWLESSAPVLSDAEGNFEITGLLPGRYDVRATSRIGEGRRLGVEAGGGGIEVTVAAFARLSGTVRTRRGEPVPAFLLEYERPDGVSVELSAHSGSWALPWLAPGRYRLRASSTEGEAQSDVLLEPASERSVSMIMVP